MSDHHTSKLFGNMKLLNFFKILESLTATSMYIALHQPLTYNLQKYLLLNLMDVVLKPNKKTCSINPMYVHQRNYIAYHLLE